jgi:hypothetical protein
MAQSPRHSLQMAKASGISDLALSLTSNVNAPVNKLTGIRADCEDDFSQSSRTSSLIDGFSRTSSAYSASDRTSATGHRNFHLKSHASRSISGSDSDWLPQDDENQSQRHRAQSPTPSMHSNYSMAFR